MFNSLEQTKAEFGTTNWTVVAGLRAEDEALRQKTAEWIAATYWPAVYACARRITDARDEASDLTQGFFSEVVLGRGLLNSATEEKGRLRSLIRSALRRYAVDCWRRERSRGKGRVVPLSDLEHEDAMMSSGSADDEFDRRWALSVLERAIELCEWHYRESGRLAHWELFERRVLRPSMRMIAPPSMAELADELGFGSTQAASAALQTVKRKLSVTLRQAVAETVAEPDEAENERRYLLDLLGMSSGDGAAV